MIDKEELSQYMAEENYNSESIDLATDQIYFINQELDKGIRLKTIIQGLGIFHKNKHLYNQ